MSIDDDDDEEEDTIFALSSAASVSGAVTAVAVFRISGPQAHHVLYQLTQRTQLPTPRRATLCQLYDCTASTSKSSMPVLDQALVLYFPGPKSFTGQDMVELHCHGSRAVLTDVVDVLASFPHCRYAEPGEFTQRAYRNNKLDVLQIEALGDLLTADTTLQRRQALLQLDGVLSKTYQDWRETLIAALAHAEAVIDFGDDEYLDGLDDNDDDEEDSGQWAIWGNVITNIQNLQHSMEQQLNDARRGELVREGLQIAILGPPNAGKSTLFNLLAKRNVAIVSDIAGTTRDVLEISLNLQGMKCCLQDTAGIRTSTEDAIELEGIQRATAAASQADIVIAMVDITQQEQGLEILQNLLLIDDKDSTQEDPDDGLASQRVDPSNVLLVLNKSDLREETTSDTSAATTNFGIAGVVEMSCANQDGVDVFLDTLTDTVLSRVASSTEDHVGVADADANTPSSLITRARHRQHVVAAVEALERFQTLAPQGSMSVDMAAEELRLAASELGRITGAVDVEDVLDKLFADFCIGK